MHLGLRKSPPKISFILCTSDFPESGVRTIASLRDQEFRDFECLIINGCSQADLSPVAVSRAANGDPRFRIVNFRAPAFIGAARNTGLRLARAQYILVLQSEHSPP